MEYPGFASPDLLNLDKPHPTRKLEGKDLRDFITILTDHGPTVGPDL